MRPIGPSRVSSKFLRLRLGVGLASLLTVTSWAARHEKADAPPPTARIATEPLGYHPLSSFYVMSRLSSSSLDFIDNEHLLFTFRTTGLLKRLPECQPEDEDQLIRALVVHLPDGKIEHSAEWRLHDRGRYLWALGGARFLLRRQEALFTTDASLELRPFLQASTPLRLVKLSPGAALLLVETDLEKHSEDEHRRLIEAAKAGGFAAPREDVQLSVIRVADRSVVLRARALNVADLPIIAEGYLEMLPGQGNHWMVRYQPFKGEARVIADVVSSCRPNASPLNDNAAVVSTCPDHGDDHIFQSISLTGKKRWSYRWDNHFIWPTTAGSESGRRIAFSTLRVGHPVDARDPIDETDLQAQRVEVVDVETGKLELTQYATPVLSAGQNYALSPDGGRFAVQRGGAIEIYDLPPTEPTAVTAEKITGNLLP